MKPKHIEARIKQCLAIAECSPCSRRKFGALLIDPKRNVVLMDGYNGGPRGSSGDLCGGGFCARDGAPKDIDQYTVSIAPKCYERQLRYNNVVVATYGQNIILKDGGKTEVYAMLQSKFPPIQSGTHMEIGCHHAEMNVITNAACNGVATADAWLIVTGEPCLLCAKLIHHAGIAKVICVQGGYAGGDAGIQYLEKNGVSIQYVDGPQDPRN